MSPLLRGLFLRIAMPRRPFELLSAPFEKMIDGDEFVDRYRDTLAELGERHSVLLFEKEDEIRNSHYNWMRELDYQIKMGKSPFSAGGYKNTLCFLCFHLAARPLIEGSRMKARKVPSSEFQKLLTGYPTQTCAIYICLEEYQACYAYYDDGDPTDCVVAVNPGTLRRACEAIAVSSHESLRLFDYFS